ncbi:MAG TPA: MerR family transcriptional regulator [Cellulomonas sp.]
MWIGELARRTGVAERLLRYYEEQGLLRPARTSAGYREYDDADVAIVAHVRTLLAAGLPTATIAEMLPCLEERDGRLTPVCADLAANLRRERKRLDAQLDTLVASRSILDGLIAAGPRP